MIEYIFLGILLLVSIIANIGLYNYIRALENLVEIATKDIRKIANELDDCVFEHKDTLKKCEEQMQKVTGKV